MRKILVSVVLYECSDFFYFHWSEEFAFLVIINMDIFQVLSIYASDSNNHSLCFPELLKQPVYCVSTVGSSLNDMI